MKAKLTVVRGKPEGLEIPVEKRLVIGRAEDCDVRPASCYVSRRHVEISIEEDRVWVRDLASRGGTYVNDDRLLANHPVPLKDGDELRIGAPQPVVFRVLVDSAEPTPRPRSAAPASSSGPRSLSDEDVTAWLVSDAGSEMPARPEHIDPGRTNIQEGFGFQ